MFSAGDLVYTSQSPCSVGRWEVAKAKSISALKREAVAVLSGGYADEILMVGEIVRVGHGTPDIHMIAIRQNRKGSRWMAV